MVLSFARTLALYDTFRILLVDCNHSNFRMSKWLTTESASEREQGGETEFDIVNTSTRNVWFVSCRETASSSGDLLSPLVRLLADQETNFDIILIDGSNLAELSDLSSLKNSVTGVVLIIESEKHRAEVLIDIENQLKSTGVKLLGTILNKKKKWIPNFVYERL